MALILFVKPPVAPAAADGPQCTFVYPRGFKVSQGTKKRPLSLCTGGDIESTWRGCELRYST